MARVGEFFTLEITKFVLNYTNLHRRRTVPDWKDLDATTVRALDCLLASVYADRSRGEASRSLWDAQAGRHIFRAAMSAKTFGLINRILRFDDRLSRPRRQWRHQGVARGGHGPPYKFASQPTGGTGERTSLRSGKSGICGLPGSP